MIAFVEPVIIGGHVHAPIRVKEDIFDPLIFVDRQVDRFVMVFAGKDIGIGIVTKKSPGAGCDPVFVLEGRLHYF